MKWLVYLYPKSWRKRYGDELIEVLRQTGCSFRILLDLLSGIIDAWNIELTEKDLYGYRISQIVVVVALFNALILLKFIPLKEVILVEQIATAAVLIAMICLALSIGAFFMSLVRFGIKDCFSLKTKLNKISFGLMGAYAVFMATFIILIN
ncbi:hypothetical protein HNO89_004275 [Sporosarcina luteola]|nr:hypothetical protein [Sporosarcina luteola]